MIQINELRYGNVLTNYQGRTGTVEGFKTGDAGHDYEHIIRFTELGVMPCYIRYCTPIPLTPEILEKCGFKTVTPNNDGSFNFWSKDLDASIDVDGDNIFLYRIHGMVRRKSITSLHQLQNLYFSLTGNDLTITL